MKKILFTFLCILNQYATAFNPSLYQVKWNQLLKKPHELAAFINGMPIGADLHLHASGAIKTEALIDIAKAQHECIDKDYHLSHPVNGLCVDGQWTDELLKIPYHYQKTLSAWSMAGFMTHEQKDRQSHFFQTFEKFDFLPQAHWPSIIAEVVNQAHSQHIHYLELMLSMHGARPNKILSPTQHYIEDVLKDTEFKAFVQHNIAYFSHLKKQVLQLTPWLEEDVDVSWVLEIKRNQPFEKFWVDAVMAFAIAHQVNDIVAINLVQPEDAKYALKDYSLQMKFLKLLKLYYPKVNVVLHAGEIPIKIAKQPERQNIKLAIDEVHPVRIGHGTMIAYEKDYQKTLQTMHQQNIAVEINLTSNEQILNIKKTEHPLNIYLKAGVPIVISSDDPGISRNQLSYEYFKAIQEHGLSLQQMIQANRNGLSYSFLPGKSLWQDHQSNTLVHQCQRLKSKSCIDFISKNQKAYQQWILEDELENYFNVFFGNTAH